MPSRLTTLFALIRRDYAVQYAGMGLGIIWLFVNYGMQIGVFWLVIGKGVYADQPHYGARLLAGMSLWIPLSEMFLRSGSILSENRVLIRRTAIAKALFVWIPVFQAFFHYLLLFLPVSLLIAFVLRAPGLTVTSLPAGLFSGWLIILFLSPWAAILSRLAIILRDLTPLLRPLMQLLFWLTPIVYLPAAWSHWNPLTFLFSVQTRLLAGLPLDTRGIPACLVLLLLTSIAAWVSSIRLNRIVEDHL